MCRDRRTFYAYDIFNHLNDVANETNNLPEGLTVSGIASSWINRYRVPLVTVIRDYETGKINLSQVSRTKARCFPQGRAARQSREYDFRTDKGDDHALVLFTRGQGISRRRKLRSLRGSENSHCDDEIAGRLDVEPRAARRDSTDGKEIGWQTYDLRYTSIIRCAYILIHLRGN